MCERPSLKPKATRPPLGVAVIAASFAINLLGLALPLVMLQIFDRIVPNHALETLLVLVLGLLVAILLDLALKGCRIVIATHVGEALEQSMTSQIVGRLLGATPQAQETLSVSDRFEATASVAQLRDAHCGEARLALIDLPFAVIFVAAVALIGGPLALVLVASCVILIIASVVFRRAQKDIYDTRKTIDGRRYSFFAEFLGKARIVKANCMETPMLRRYELLQEQSVAASRSLITVNGVSQGFNATMSQATLGAVALAGGAMVIHGALGIAELAACTLLSGRAIQPMFRLSGLWVQGESAASATQRCRDVLELPQRDSQPKTPLTGLVELDAVSVKLDAHDKPLFSDVSFTCRPGECIAISGDDGAGKTTLLRLILGEQAPTSGAVFLDGKPSSAQMNARGKGGVAYLDQTPVMFECNILQNLTLSDDPAHRGRALAAASRLGLTDAVNRLPQGFETLIGGKGATHLPDGILQLVAVVRALAAQPSVILFNEANTAMDAKTDQTVLRALSDLRGRTSLILVTRRPSYIAIADTQVNLSAGETTIRRLDALKEIPAAPKTTTRAAGPAGAPPLAVAPRGRGLQEALQ